MAINWDTVQTAAATAVVVTLVVEYAAKPRLEARKERILAAHRSRRELVALIADLTQSAGVLAEEIPRGAGPQLQERIRQERGRQEERLRARASELFDNVNVRYSASYVAPIRDQVLEYAGCVLGVVLSPRSAQHKAEVITGLSGAMLGILQPQWWHPLRHAAAREQLAALIADTRPPPTTTPDGTT